MEKGSNTQPQPPAPPPVNPDEAYKQAIRADFEVGTQTRHLHLPNGLKKSKGAGS